MYLFRRLQGNDLHHDGTDYLFHYISRFGFHTKSYQLHWPNLTVPLNPVLKFIVDRCTYIFKIPVPVYRFQSVDHGWG